MQSLYPSYLTFQVFYTEHILIEKQVKKQTKIQILWCITVRITVSLRSPSPKDQVLGFLICEIRPWTEKGKHETSVQIVCLFPGIIPLISPGREWIIEYSAKNLGCRVKIPGFQSLSQDPTLPSTSYVSRSPEFL